LGHEKTGNRLAYVTSGCIRIPTGELPERIRTLFEGLREVISVHQPAQV